ncbi:MAG: 4Fe-4S binding protein [Planctomycetota bacterium]|jgi:ferredoxin
MRTASLLLAALVLAVSLSSQAAALERFPRPQFETEHELPAPTAPAPRSDYLEYVDVAVLFAALCLAALLALKVRWRLAIFALVLFAVAYFGFYRRGCVCAVGSLQNVALACFDRGYAVPLFVTAFFVLPLLFAVAFGRVFCAAVCPLGAVQDIFVVKPLKVPQWLEHSLGTLPYVYLALAIVFVAAGAPFIVCQYDPFVSFFRLSGPASMLILGGAFLLVGMIVARPYCRYLCPYSVLLRWTSYFSFRHATITPDECVKCRLCENSCPFGAIRPPTPEQPGEPRRIGVRRLAVLIVLAPVLTLGGAFAGGLAGPALSRAHKTVLTAREVVRSQEFPDEAPAFEAEAFFSTGQSAAELYARASAVRDRFTNAALIAGALLGLALSVKLICLSIRRTRTDYEPDKARCLSCGRCFQFCPREQLRRSGEKESPE